MKEENKKVIMDTDWFLEDSSWDIFYEFLEQFNIQLSQEIVVIADLGFWDGRATGYKVVDSGNIKDCFRSEYDGVWYIDENGDLRADVYHHDGTNYYLYRELKSDLYVDDIEDFYELIVEGKATREVIDKYSRAIGSDILENY